MKQQTIFKLIGVSALILTLAACFGFDFGILETSGLVCMATAAVVGTPVEGTASVPEFGDIAEQDIDSDITNISPNKTPFDTISRNIRKATQCKSQEIKYYQKSNKPLADSIDTSATGAGTSYAVPCSSYTLSDDGITKVYIQVLQPKLWRVNDTLLMADRAMQGSPGAAIVGGVGTFTENQMFYVTGKTDRVLELTPIGGMKGKAASSVSDEWVVPSFTSDTLLIRMGQAKKEKDLTSEPIAIMPVSSVNYCQNFITQIEESTFAALTKKEIEFGIDDFDRDNLESMRAEMELSFLFGQRAKLEGTNGDTVYFTGGISNEVKKVITYGNGGADRSMTDKMYMGMLQEVFVGTNGSAERTLYAGSELIKSFELLREAQKNINGATTQATYHGVIVTKILSTFGTINLVHNPIFDEIGMADKGLVLDMTHIYRRPFVPMIAKELDLKSSGIKNATARTVQECSCVILKYPDCHAWIVPKA